MKVETGKVHIVRSLGDIETVKPEENAPMQPAVDLPGLSCLEQVRQRPVPEGLYHGTYVYV
jgi:hypothetical protein